MRFIELLRQRLAEMHETRNGHIAEIEALAAVAETEERSALNDAEEARYQELRGLIDALKPEIEATEKRIAELEAIDAQRTEAGRRAPVSGILPSPTENVDVSRLTDNDARGRARTMVEQHAARFVHSDHAQELIRKIDTRGVEGAAIARLALVTGSDEYCRAWAKAMSGNTLAMTEKERFALSRGYDAYSAEERALTSGTQATGGYFVPVYLDPTMIIQGGGEVNPIREMATVKQIGPAFGGWYGVTVGQVSAAWTAEGQAAPDSTPTFDQPNIPVYMAEAFVAASYQALEDIDNLAADVLTLFQEARDNLEADAYATGTGTTHPIGVLTAVAAVTADIVDPVTAGTLSIDDAFKVHPALPPRFRSKPASRGWLANIAVIDHLRASAMGKASANSVWTDASADQPARLLGDPIREASKMSGTITTGQNVLLYGDFRRYYIVDRVGFTTEFIPNLFDVTTGRPTAQRGWLSHWRTGGDVVDTTAFRLLQL